MVQKSGEPADMVDTNILDIPSYPEFSISQPAEPDFFQSTVTTNSTMDFSKLRKFGGQKKWKAWNPGISEMVDKFMSN